MRRVLRAAGVRAGEAAAVAGRSRCVDAGRATQVHLLHVESPVVLPRGHVAVVAENYDAAVARLRDAGHDVEARREHWGSPRAYVHDPAGNLVEVMAFPPGG